MLRLAIDPVVEKYKRENRNNKEAIVEPNESDQGSKAGQAVPATDLGLTPDDWEANQELEDFLSLYPYDIKETIEHKGHCTGAQALMLLADLKDNFCHSQATLEVKALPDSLKVVHRERKVETKAVDDLTPMIDTARFELRQELQSRCFDNRPSNARMVLLYMSKQMDVKDILTNAQYELAKSLYFHWLRTANSIVKLPTRESSPRKAQKTTTGGRLFRGAGAVATPEAPAARNRASDGFGE